jgi:hypothetical protein
LKNSISRTVYSTIACLLASVLCLASYASSNIVPLYEAWDHVDVDAPANGGISYGGWRFERRTAIRPEDEIEEEDLIDELTDEILLAMRLSGGILKLGFEKSSIPSNDLLVKILSIVASPITYTNFNRIEDPASATHLHVTYAIPVDQIKPIEISRDAFVETLIEYLTHTDSQFSRDIWDSPFELLNDCVFDSDLKTASRNHLLQSYSAALGHLIYGNKPDGLGVLWVRIPRSMTDKEISQLTDWEILDLLEQRVGDPYLMREVALRSETNCHPVANFFSKSKFDRWEWGPLELKKLNSEPVFQASTLPESSIVDCILKSNGKIPIAASSGYSANYEQARKLFFKEEPDLTGSLVCLFQSIDEMPTVDNLNLAAACLIELVLPNYATPFAFMANSMDSTHSYAGVNLVRAMNFDSTSKPTTFELLELITEVREHATLNAWGTKQLNLIEESLARSPVADHDE